MRAACGTSERSVGLCYRFEIDATTLDNGHCLRVTDISAGNAHWSHWSEAVRAKHCAQVSTVFTSLSLETGTIRTAHCETSTSPSRPMTPIILYGGVAGGPAVPSDKSRTSPQRVHDNVYDTRTTGRTAQRRKSRLISSLSPHRWSAEC